MSKRRLYYGRLLRDIEYFPAWGNHVAKFVAKLLDSDYRLHVYEADTIYGVMTAMKADGWIIWGKDVLDYALPPRNAFEYILIEQVTRGMGATDKDIQECFSLDYGAGAGEAG